MIKELITIANELDKRGLVSEASIVDKIAGDILQFDFSKRKNPISPKEEEEESDIIPINRGIESRKTEILDALTEDIDPLLIKQLQNEAGKGEPAPLGWDDIVENNYFENPIVHPNGAEQVVESEDILRAFIEEHLMPYSIVSAKRLQVLADLLYSDDRSLLREYIMNEIPALIGDLSEKLNDGDSPEIHKELIIRIAKEMYEYINDEDFKSIIDAMEHYLE